VKSKDGDTLLQTLKARFGKNPKRHPGIAWDDVLKKIGGDRQALRVLGGMEASGGEPDVVAGLGRTPRDLVFCDCSPESPAGRRSTCYDAEARTSRKEHAPKNSAIEMAAAMGIELLTEAQYRHLQTLGEFDLKTSSWIQTPGDVRSLGGALFCDRRYDTVFVYHNGAQSYYAARGFRGLLRL
jgi:hypothetical protein